MNRAKTRDGQVAMSVTFLIGGVMIIIGGILVFVVMGFINSTYGYRAANQALSLASAGVEDALLKLARNKDFSSLGYCVPDTTCGVNSATVTVTQDTPSQDQATIISSARVERRQRKIKTVVSIASSTGQVGTVSWELLTQ